MKRCLFPSLTLCLFAVLLLNSCQKEPEDDPNGTVTPTDSTGTVTPTDSTGLDPLDDSVIFNMPIGTVIPDVVADIDGNLYDGVVIGHHLWMVQNLMTTRYANGDPIMQGGQGDTSRFVPYRYVPDCGTADVAIYGYLYNWPAVMHGEPGSSENPSGVQGICPDGWHVPSDAEFVELANTISSHPEYVFGDDIRQIDKSIASEFWWHSSGYANSCGNNQQLNNATHFGMIPAGSGPFGSPGGVGLGYFAHLWSCTPSNKTQARIRYMNHQSARAFHCGADYDPFYSFSVRCARD